MSHQETVHPESTPRLTRLAWQCSPAQVIAHWPKDRPLAALLSGASAQPATAAPNAGHSPAPPDPERRWSILTSPVREDWLQTPHTPPGHGAHASIVPSQLEPMLFAVGAVQPSSDLPPFQGGWLLALKYELGEVIEPSVRSATDQHASDGGVYLRCPAGLVYDHHLHQWWAVSESPCWEASAKHPLAWFANAPFESAHHETDHQSQPLKDPGASAQALIPDLHATMTPEAYASLVLQAKHHIEQGDIYQVNLTHQLQGTFTGSTRALLLTMLRRAQPWYGAYFELGCNETENTNDRQPSSASTTLLSISPELFLRVEPSGHITTRPMKGTRRADARGVAANHAHASKAELELSHSEKEQAELTMIVDLMRNDLGRLCQAGSVHVSQPRRIESHHAGTILQATAAITGTLRSRTTLEEILRATFPPGSITGAPKVSAMKIIRRLEASPRGFYCGAIGYCSSHGAMALSVAIRTLVIEGSRAVGQRDVFAPSARASYGVGAGIVADSDPSSEWLETLEKAKIMQSQPPTPSSQPPWNSAPT